MEKGAGSVSLKQNLVKETQSNIFEKNKGLLALGRKTETSLHPELCVTPQKHEDKVQTSSEVVQLP